MADVGVMAAAALLGAVALITIVYPERMVMVLGVYLFAQSAVVRVGAIPEVLRTTIGRMDEAILLVLVLRFAARELLARRTRLPPALWALAAFVAVGVLSAAANGVAAIPAAVGIFLTIKGGLWMFVALHLRYDRKVMMRFATLIGAIFIAVVAVAWIQFAGVTLPWDPHVRRSGELAATSIWNQHTVFGSALAALAGLSVLFLRLPGWRGYGLVLVFASLVGAVLSTTRRLFISLPAAAGVVLAYLPRDERDRWFRAAAAVVRKRWILVLFGVILVAGTLLIGERMVRIATDTWDEYVVHAASRDRYALFRGGWNLLVQYPLVGRGPATFGSFASVLFDSTAYEEIGVKLPDTLKLGAPYASLIGEFGLAGIGAFAAFILLTLRQLAPLIRAGGDPIGRALAGAGTFLVVDMAIESVVHVSFSDSFVSFFGFTCVGAALAASMTPSTDAPVPQPERRWVVGSLLGAAMLMAALIFFVWLLSRA